MRLHAFLRENVVVKVEEIDENQYIEQIKDYQNIIDVHDLLTTPSVGYVLSGNQLVPGPGQSVSIKQLIIGRITNYQAVAPTLLKDLYADNTLMGITAAQSDEMFDEYQDVIIRLSQGAFPTAIYRLQQKTPSGFVTQEILDNWIARIQAYIV